MIIAIGLATAAGMPATAWSQASAPLATLFAPSRELPDPVRFRTRLELGDLDQAKAWLDAGLDPNFLGDRIGTGLMIAAWEGNLAMMALFVARGADINKPNALGEQAVMHAAWRGHFDAVKWLVERGARLDPGPMQWTALHYAVFANRRDIAEYLLARGADINAQSPNGSSVLMMAVYEGHEDMARGLLERGADRTIRNENGDGALEWAMKFDRLKVARLIASEAEFAAAASRPRTSWGRVARSEFESPAIQKLLEMRKRLEAQGLKVDKLDRRIAALRARAAREALERDRPPAATLEISARRNAPAEQRARLIYDGTPRPEAKP